MNDASGHPVAVIDPRAIHRLYPYVEQAIDGQADPYGVRLAIKVYGLAVTVTEDEVPIAVASVMDNSGEPHALCRVPAHCVGLHRVDGHLLYLSDPILDD